MQEKSTDTSTWFDGLADFLVIDLEATCSDDATVPRSEMETIEIGAVLLGANDLTLIGEFQTFIRPVRHPRLTPFCTKLTSITDTMLANAPSFPEAAHGLKTWIYARSKRIVFVSWGDYDRRQLDQDCAFHRVPNPIGASHLNAKACFTQTQRLRKRPGLGEAVRLADLAFDGVAHRGIDDARNIARLMPFVLGKAALPILN